MRGFDHRRSGARRRRTGGSRARSRVVVSTFAQVPTVIFPACGRIRLEIDFLVQVLADVADDQVVGLRIETETERVAQAVVPDFRALTGLVDEWIRRRDCVLR